MVNGTAHDINIVMYGFFYIAYIVSVVFLPTPKRYNDADDPVLAALLYERLATIDNVHAFFGPSGLVGPACYAIAQKYHVRIPTESYCVCVFDCFSLPTSRYPL